MKNIRNFFSKFTKDESAQGATEYILLLVVVVGIALIFKNQIKDIVTEKINEVASNIKGFSVE